MSKIGRGIDTLDELVSWKPPYVESIISDGILKAGTGVIIFGGAKAWKSMLALHTACCIAEGKDWFGYKTQSAIVLKYQCELPKYIDRERVVKYMNGNRPEKVLLKTNPYVKIDTGMGRNELDLDIKAVEKAYPESHIVLILDPIYLMLSGHVSDEYDVKKFLEAVSLLKSTHNLSVILIHHSHKTRVDASGNIIDLGSEEIMGSSYFNNWADTMIRVKMLNPNTGSNKVEVSFDLVRHAQKLLPGFEIVWSRDNLRPNVVATKEVLLSAEEISVTKFR